MLEIGEQDKEDKSWGLGCQFFYLIINKHVIKYLRKYLLQVYPFIFICISYNHIKH